MTDEVVTKKYLTLDDPLIETVYPIALEAAEWALARWPHIQRDVTAIDIANTWILDKFRFLGSYDPRISSLRYQVFLGVKRNVCGLIFTDNSTVSLDEFVQTHNFGDTVRWVDTFQHDLHPTEYAEFTPEAFEEMLKPLEDLWFGSESGETHVEVESLGCKPKTLKSVAELLLLGFNKREIGDIFGVGKMYISRLTRGRMADALGFVL